MYMSPLSFYSSSISCSNTIITTTNVNVYGGAREKVGAPSSGEHDTEESATTE